MKTYQFLVECVFISPGGKIGVNEAFGFFSTITIRGGSLKAAANKIPDELAQRMLAHRVGITKVGICRTRCRIVELWELPGSDMEFNDLDDTGFTLFRIGYFSLPLVLLKFSWVSMFQSHMLVRIR